MIYTVTFNPSIDYIMRIDELSPGRTYRSRSEMMTVGGKGINVSIVLAELGIKSTALGFVGGFTGQAIEEFCRENGLDTNFTHLESGNSRINIKIKSAEETEINAQGPQIPEDALTNLLAKTERLQDGDTLVLAGSVPDSVPDDIYGQILTRLTGRGVRVVVDATKNLLLNTLKFRPFLIKPNIHELRELFGADLKSEEEIIAQAEKLREMGAMNVLVSMAERGSILVDEFNEVHRCGACLGTVSNSVGAGDSMVAGFLAGVMRNSKDARIDYEYALRLGTAAGGATTFSDTLATRDEILRLMNQMN